MRIRLTLAAGAVLALAACSSSTSGSPAGHPPASRPPAATPPSTAPATKSPATKAPGIDPTKGTDLAAFCSLIGRNNRLMADIAQGDGRNGGIDPARFTKDLEATLAAAPAEIKPDLQVIVSFDEQVVAQHREIKETPQLTTAMQHYAAWLGQHCVRR